MDSVCGTSGRCILYPNKILVDTENIGQVLFFLVPTPGNIGEKASFFSGYTRELCSKHHVIYDCWSSLGSLEKKLSTW